MPRKGHARFLGGSGRGDAPLLPNRIGEGRALYTGVLKAAGARAFVEAAPGEEFRYRNAPLRRMTVSELAEALDPDLVYDCDLLGAEDA